MFVPTLVALIFNILHGRPVALTLSTALSRKRKSWKCSSWNESQSYGGYLTSVPSLSSLALSYGCMRTVDIPYQNNDTMIDYYFMGLALKQAQYALEKGEVPIGAVIVRECSVDEPAAVNGFTRKETSPKSYTQSVPKRTFCILSEAHNQVETNFDASAHAELLALRKGSYTLQNWRYPPNSRLYTTLEPCPMCMASIQAFRIDSVVYGAPDKRLGAVGTHMDLLNVAKHPYHDVKSVVGGVRGEECGDIMVNFFRERRKMKKEVERETRLVDFEMNNSLYAIDCKKGSFRFWTYARRSMGALLRLVWHRKK